MSDRTQAEAMLIRAKVLRNHLEGLKLDLYHGCYASAYTLEDEPV
jgi:hypothetical protein